MPPKGSATKIGKSPKKKKDKDKAGGADKEKEPKERPQKSQGKVLQGDSFNSSDSVNIPNSGEKEKSGKKSKKNLVAGASTPNQTTSSLNTAAKDALSRSSTEDSINVQATPSKAAKGTKSRSHHHHHHHHHHRTHEERRNKKVQASSIKFCNGIVDKIWVNSWNICAERFLQGNAPLAVSLELRDTWLRIIEAEWLDQDQPREDVTPEMFLADKPPLPLAFDSWSRGAIEVLPNARRESVLDPFLRDAQQLGFRIDGSGSGDAGPSIKSSAVSIKEKDDLDKSKPNLEVVPKETTVSVVKEKKKKVQPTLSQKKVAKKVPVKPSPSERVKKVGIEKLKEKEKPKEKVKRKKSKEPKKVKKIKDEPQVIDTEGESEVYPEDQPGVPVNTAATSRLNTYLTSDEVCGEDEELEGEYFEDMIFIPDLPYRCALPPRKTPSPKVVYDLEELMPLKKFPSEPFSPSMSEEYVQLGQQPWSPSQCGGRTGSIVFKLPTEHSSEAMRRARRERKERFGQEGAVEEREAKNLEPQTIFFNKTDKFFDDEIGGEDIEHPMGDSRGYEGESEEESDQGHRDEKQITETLTGQAEDTGHVDLPTVSEPSAYHLNVIARIDNLAHADSDELVHILAPHEAPTKSERESEKQRLKHFNASKAKSKSFARSKSIARSKSNASSRAKSISKSVKSGNVNDHESNAGHTRRPTVAAGTSERFQLDKKHSMRKKKEADVNVRTDGAAGTGKEKTVKVILSPGGRGGENEAEEKPKGSILDVKDVVINRHRKSIKGRVKKSGVKFNEP